jgi:hypothetical protein
VTITFACRQWRYLWLREAFIIVAVVFLGSISHGVPIGEGYFSYYVHGDFTFQVLSAVLFFYMK